jgi:hypothetical protein
MGKQVVRVCLIAALLALTCGCTEKLEALSSAVKEAQAAKFASGSMLDEARKAKQLTGLTAKETEQRTALWKSVDDIVLRSAYAAADLTGEKAWVEIGKAASTIVDGTILKTDQEGRFTDALISITKEKVKGKACGLILDQVAPKPEDSDQAVHSDDPINETIGELKDKGWTVPGDNWRPIVKWAEWLQGVVEAADQVQTSVVNGTTDIELFARPPVARAAVAYARFCYSPPKAIG